MEAGSGSLPAGRVESWFETIGSHCPPHHPIFQFREEGDNPLGPHTTEAKLTWAPLLKEKEEQGTVGGGELCV